MIKASSHVTISLVNKEVNKQLSLSLAVPTIRRPRDTRAMPQKKSFNPERRKQRQTSGPQRRRSLCERLRESRSGRNITHASINAEKSGTKVLPKGVEGLSLKLSSVIVNGWD